MTKLVGRDAGFWHIPDDPIPPALNPAASALRMPSSTRSRSTSPLPNSCFDVVFSKDAMVHIENKAALYSEVLRILKPGGWFTAADWLWSDGAAESPVVDAWLSKGPLKFEFTPPAAALQAMMDAGFSQPHVTDLRLRLQQSNRREIEVLEGPARQRLAAIVGETMANNRLASAKGRQAALDSGDLIPSHLRGQRPK